MAAHEEEHAEHAEPFMEGYLHLLTNAPHWAFEITGEVVSSLVAYPVIRLMVRVWVARHDAQAHATTHVKDVERSLVP